MSITLLWHFAFTNHKNILINHDVFKNHLINTVCSPEFKLNIWNLNIGQVSFVYKTRQVTSQIKSSKVVTYIRIKFSKWMVKQRVHVITISMATAEKGMSVKDSTLLWSVSGQIVISRTAGTDIFNSANTMQARVFVSLGILAHCHWPKEITQGQIWGPPEEVWWSPQGNLKTWRDNQVSPV